MAHNLRHSAVLTAIENGRWAMTPDALRGVLAVVDRGGEEISRPIFHATAPGTRDALAADVGQPADGLKYSYVRGSTGVIFIDGPIIPRADTLSDISGITSIESLSADFRAMQADHRVDHIVLAIDSPGGNIVGVSEFAQAIRASDKKTTAYIYGMAASAAYWIASAAHSVISTDTGEAGSIGVVMTYRDTSKQDAARGVETIEIVSSQAPYKRPNLQTEDGRASVQVVLDDLASVFIDSVARYRGTTAENVAETFGQGGMVAAARAVTLGMVDAIGTLESILSTSDSTRPAVGSARPSGPKRMEAADMSATISQPITAEALATAHPEAVQAIQIAAATAERARIQGIESLMDTVAGAPAQVVSAAAGVINAAKYDPSKTSDNVARDVLVAVGKAQIEASAAAASGPRNLAAALPVSPSTPAPTTAEADADDKAATVAELSAALKTA